MITTPEDMVAALDDMERDDRFARVKQEYRRLVAIEGSHQLSAVTDAPEGHDVILLVCLAVRSCYENEVADHAKAT